MIALLPGESRARFPRITDEMYELRLDATRARLDRPLGAINRLTVVDYFDSLDPLYVLALDDAGRILGAIRLLPTTGVTMLNDAFAATLPERGRIESPLIWEASRLTLDASGNSPAQVRSIDRAVGELGCALNEIAQAAGLTHLIGVFDRAAYDLLSSRGCAGEALTPPLSLDSGQICVSLYEVGPAMDAQFIGLAGEDARRRVNLAELDSMRSTVRNR